MAGSGLYLGLLIYGAGVLILSFFGVLGQDHDQDGSAEAEGGAHAGDGHGDGHHEGDGQDGHDLQRAESSVALLERARKGGLGITAVSRIASLLRSSVFFAFGAGATGLFAEFRGLGAFEGAAWALGAGLLTLAIARIARRLFRRDLDSSFKREEFLMEEGLVIVGAPKGQMGKAEVRKYGASVELYVRASDPSLALAKGDRVRVVDYSDDCYYVEPVSDSIGCKGV